MLMSTDPFAQLKAVQRETWAMFSPQATFTIPPAACLVNYANLQRVERVLDVACVTGVVAITAARAGAHICGLDLAPALLHEARMHASMTAADIEFSESDVVAMP